MEKSLNLIPLKQVPVNMLTRFKAAKSTKRKNLHLCSEIDRAKVVRRYCWPLLWHWQGADCKQDSAQLSQSTKISSGPIQQSGVLRTLLTFLLLCSRICAQQFVKLSHTLEQNWSRSEKIVVKQYIA